MKSGYVMWLCCFKLHQGHVGINDINSFREVGKKQQLFIIRLFKINDDVNNDMLLLR